MNWYAFFGLIGLVIAAFLYAGLVFGLMTWFHHYIVYAWWTLPLFLFMFVVLPLAVLAGLTT